MTFLARDGPFEWVRPIPNAPERSWHASGPIFSPNYRFWIHFGPFLMFWARLENQVWAKVWPGTPNQASRFRNFFLGPIPELFSASCSSPRNAKSGFELTYFQAFPGNANNNVGSAGSTLFLAFPGNAAKNLQKKVPESAGLVGACPGLTSDLSTSWLLEAATAADFD